MNTVVSDVAGQWIFQQDYMTFLAVLGWLTAGLIAWGNAASGADARAMPWKWFAFFAFFASLDGTLDLAKMVTPQVWPHPFDPLVRLCSYGCLLEFAREMSNHLKWTRIRGWLPAALPFAAGLLVFCFPKTSPVPESIIATFAGVAASAGIIATVRKGNRPLLAAAAAIVLLGPVEMLRSQGGVTLDGLYGLYVTGEGVETALCACVIAWVVSISLWLHGVLRRRTGLFAGRPEAFSPLATFVLPAVLAITLTAGYVLVNWSSARVRHDIGHDYLNRVSTAALAFDPEVLARDPADVRLRNKMREVRSRADDLLRAYLWNFSNGRTAVNVGLIDGEGQTRGDAAIKTVGIAALPSLPNAQLIGPVPSRDAAVIIASAPIVATGTNHEPVAWLSLDILPQEWLASQAWARLQTIAIVGLFASLVVFFLAHQMLREYEAELLVAKESAEAADRAKDEFLAVMSHEIRTPMQSVLGYSDLMSRTPLTSAQTGYIDTIRSQGRTLLRIVQDILDFSILRKSSYTLKSETVYLRQLLENAFETIKPLAARKNLAFDISIADDLPAVVVGDGVRIEQILFNLLGNAVKFTDHGGVRLDVSVDRAENNASPDARCVLFTISDTGMGIRQADVRRLFEPFTRLSYAEATPREGAGLGLAIVKRLCELMGGRIDLESEWGKGTRFLVRLPLAVVEPPAPSTDSSGTASESGKPVGIVNLGAILPLRVLVAEDNPYIRRLMVEYLRSIGFEPTAVETGVQAVERWQEFDLLIMDLRMPGMDGVTAAGRIRAAANNEIEPWIIGVSATLSENEIQRAMMAGMNDFLGKPFFVQSLIEAIQASPLFVRRRSALESSVPPTETKPAAASAAAASVAPKHAPEMQPRQPSPPPAPESSPVPPAPAGMMSWMPDLSASGDNEIVEQAVGEIPGIMDEIAESLRTGALENAAERAHYLKNTIFALRMEPMIAPCRAVFERASAKNAEAARQSLDALRSAFDDWKKDRAAKTASAAK